MALQQGPSLTETFAAPKQCMTLYPIMESVELHAVYGLGMSCPINNAQVAICPGAEHLEL